MIKLWNGNTAKEQKWYKKPLDGCVDSKGNPYSITLKKGTVNNLLVNFIGGGLSWNEETAANPLSVKALFKGQETFYISNVSRMVLEFIHVGILNANNAQNPFHNWYVLNIPYTTADFHIGCSEYSYKTANGTDKILYHHGAKNVASALAVLKEFFIETPETLVVAGQSAGAFGCIAHSPQIKNIYPDCDNIIIYSDGSHLYSSFWPEIVKNIWKVNPGLIEYITGSDLVIDLFHFAQDNMPPHTVFLHSNSVWDMELTKYMNKLNHDKMAVNDMALHEFHDSLINAVKKLKKEIKNYTYYLTDYGKNKKNGTTPHIFSGDQKLLYSKMQDNMSIAEWLNRAIKKEPIDIGKKFIL